MGAINWAGFCSFLPLLWVTMEVGISLGMLAVPLRSEGWRKGWGVQGNCDPRAGSLAGNHGPQWFEGP